MLSVFFFFFCSVFLESKGHRQRSRRLVGPEGASTGAISSLETAAAFSRCVQKSVLLFGIGTGLKGKGGSPRLTYLPAY